MANKTELATFGEFDPSKYLAFRPEIRAELVEAMQDNLSAGMGIMQLPRYKVPTGGALLWTIDSLSGDSEGVKALEGVIIARATQRAYWKGATVGNNPPNCTSPDGKNARPGGDPGEQYGNSCLRCPLSAFGSKLDPRTGEATSGQACKQMTALIIQRAQSRLPGLLLLPPTSVQVFDRFLIGLTNEGLSYRAVEISLTLEKVTAGGNIYSRIVPALKSKLSPDDRAAVREFGSFAEDMLKETQIRKED